MATTQKELDRINKLTQEIVERKNNEDHWNAMVQKRRSILLAKREERARRW